jgi:transcription elongation factor Elf1
MGVEKQYSEYVLTCDVCGQECDETFETFQDAVDYKNENGWDSEFYHGEWSDVCPDCQ